MDEATSALDKKTESEIYYEIKKLKESKSFSIIAITHNVDNLKFCNRIYNIENGRIVDIGDHNNIANLAKDE